MSGFGSTVASLRGYTSHGFERFRVNTLATKIVINQDFNLGATRSTGALAEKPQPIVGLYRDHHTLQRSGIAVVVVFTMVVV